MPRSKLDVMAKAIIKLYEKTPSVRIKVRAEDGTYIELDGREIRQAIKGSKDSPATLGKLAFNESYRYLKNAEDRFNTKTVEGYSDCKANCRNALMSALKTLTGKEEVSEAARELSRQGLLGKREQEFTETFNRLLVILHGLDSKKGSHPPMTRNEDDAELALSITTSVVNYLINQATRQRS